MYKFLPLIVTALFLSACAGPAIAPTAAALPAETLIVVETATAPANIDAVDLTPAAPAIETQSAPTATILTAETLAGMTVDQKLSVAPEGKDGYIRSGLSTVIDSIVIYRDANAAAVQTYDLQTGEMLPIAESKIVEFPMEGGGYYEMKAFNTVEEILQEIIVNDGATYGLDIAETASKKAFNSQKWSILGLGEEFKSGVAIKVLGAEDVLELPIFSILDGSAIQYQSDERVRKVLFLRGREASQVASDLMVGQYPIPAKPLN